MLLINDAFVNAIQLMIFLSARRWDNYIYCSIVLAETERKEEIVLSPLVQGTSPLQIKHAVWGL